MWAGMSYCATAVADLGPAVAGFVRIVARQAASDIGDCTSTASTDEDRPKPGYCVPGGSHDCGELLACNLSDSTPGMQGIAQSN